MEGRLELCVSGLVGGRTQVEGNWSYVLVDNGLLYATSNGVLRMQLLCADNYS